MNRSYRNGLFLLLAALILTGGFGALMALRYHGTDVYPPYSSFRADQTGTKVLYESLLSLGWRAERLLRPAPELNHPEETCVLVAALPGDMIRDRDLINLASAGARVVVGFSPGSGVSDQLQRTKKRERWRKQSKGPLLNLELMRMATPPKLPGTARPDASTTLPPLHYYSDNYFRHATPDWKTLYTFYDRPVIVERQFGRGSLVFCADNFIFTNEALATEKNASLLLWLFGNKKRIVFEETHLGLYSERNLVWLAGKYDLGPFIIVLTITVLLFLWRQLTAVSAAPPEAAGEIRSATELSGQALTALLRTTYRVRDLPQLGLKCWLDSAAARHCAPNRLERIRTASAAHSDDPLHSYNEAVKQYHRREDRNHG